MTKFQIAISKSKKSIKALHWWKFLCNGLMFWFFFFQFFTINFYDMAWKFRKVLLANEKPKKLNFHALSDTQVSIIGCMRFYGTKLCKTKKNGNSLKFSM